MLGSFHQTHSDTDVRAVLAAPIHPRPLTAHIYLLLNTSKAEPTHKCTGDCLLLLLGSQGRKGKQESRRKEGWLGAVRLLCLRLNAIVH